MRRLVVFGVVLALLALISPRTLAATPTVGHVSDTATTTAWSGPIFLAGTYTDGDRGAQCFDASGQPNPPQTTGPGACDVFTLFVDVPASFWTNKAGGVAVRLDNFSFNDLDLYVYARNADGTKGAFVTSSGGLAGRPENAIIDNASGGYYVAAVAFAATATSYDGHATFFIATGGHAAVPPTVTNPPGYPAYRASQDQYISHSEPHIAMNPRDHDNLVAGSKMYVNLGNYLFKVGMYASFDGGRTWTDTGQLPGYVTANPSECTGGPNGQTFSEACLLTTSDVWTTFDDEGNAYAMVLYAPGGAASTGWGMNLHKSSDGGRTWSGPIVIHDHVGGLLRDLFLDDKNALAVDNYTQVGLPLAANASGDGHIGTIYSCWNLDDANSGLHQDLVVSTSMDGGATWSFPELVSLGQDLEIGCQFAIAPSGTVFVSWFQYATTAAGQPGQMFVASSVDHGVTWTPPRFVALVNALPTQLPGSRFRNLSIPAFAASPVDGSLYITWADYHTAANGTKDGDILFSKSTNGVAWDAPKRVNQDPIGNGKDQFQPQIAITSSGQVNISYFDRRNDPDNFFIDTYLSRSDDGGAHWSDIRVTQKMWDPSINPPISTQGDFIGDYQGLVADDDVAIPFWQDTHIGAYQEAFSARVPNRADLSVAGISFSNSKAPEGEKVTITARVANIGYRAASKIAVRFAVDGVAQGADQTIASLAAGASADVSVGWPSQGKPGTHTILVTVDPVNTIPESDETNNAGTATFFVKANKVQNSSFEQASTTNPGQPANWTPTGSGTRYDVSGGHAADGFAVAGIVAGALPGQAGKWTSDAIPVVAGTYYEVNATLLTGGTAANPTIVVAAAGAANRAAAPLLALTQLVPINTVTQLVGQVQIPAGVSEVVIELREELDQNLSIYYDKIGLFAPD